MSTIFITRCVFCKVNDLCKCLVIIVFPAFGKVMAPVKPVYIVATMLWSDEVSFN